MPAWLVQMRYKGTEAIYPPGLSSYWCRRVFHLMVDGECPIIGSDEKKPVPGARWDPDFQWPEPPALPPPVEVPAQYTTDLQTAAVALKALLTLPEWKLFCERFQQLDPETLDDKPAYKLALEITERLQELTHGA